MPADTCCRAWSHRNRVGQRLDFFLCSRRQFVPILPQIESNSDSIYYVCAFFRDSKAIAFSCDRFVIQIFIRQNHFQRHILPKASNHRAQAVTTTAQRPKNWEQSACSYHKEIGSLSDPISSRPSAAAGVSGHRPPPARINTGRKPSPRRRSNRKVGNTAISPTKEEIEALPDSISPRPNAAAGVSGGTPPKRGSNRQRAPPAQT